MRYAITGWPNTPQHRKAANKLRPEGYHQRKRGRGCRMNRPAWHQSIPLSDAMYFTLYGAPPIPNKYGVTYQTYINFRARFVRIEPNGKVRIKYQWPSEAELVQREKMLQWYAKQLISGIDLNPATEQHYYTEYYTWLTGNLPKEGSWNGFQTGNS